MLLNIISLSHFSLRSFIMCAVSLLTKNKFKIIQSDWNDCAFNNKKIPITIYVITKKRNFGWKSLQNLIYQIPGTNVILEEGTSILISNYLLQRDEKFHLDPLEFDPTRFSKESKKWKSSIDMPFLAFGEGPQLHWNANGQNVNKSWFGFDTSGILCRYRWSTHWKGDWKFSWLIYAYASKLCLFGLSNEKFTTFWDIIDARLHS